MSRGRVQKTAITLSQTRRLPPLPSSLPSDLIVVPPRSINQSFIPLPPYSHFQCLLPACRFLSGLFNLPSAQLSSVQKPYDIEVSSSPPFCWLFVLHLHPFPENVYPTFQILSRMLSSPFPFSLSSVNLPLCTDSIWKLWTSLRTSNVSQIISMPPEALTQVGTAMWVTVIKAYLVQLSFLHSVASFVK